MRDNAAQYKRRLLCCRRPAGFSTPHIPRTLIAVALVAMLGVSAVAPDHVLAMPEFSRQYGTPCKTCHLGFPKLNDLGRAFKDAGFGFPEKDLPLIEEPSALLSAASESSFPGLRAMDGQYSSQLNWLRRQIQAQHFPYPFHLRQTTRSVQRPAKTNEDAIRFGKLNDAVVLEISGEYHAVYSRDRVNVHQRVAQTFDNVVLPILKVAGRRFGGDERVFGYAIEISQHVRGKVLGVTVEASENVGWVLRREVAKQLIAAKTDTERRNVLRKGQVYLNAEPISPPGRTLCGRIMPACIIVILLGFIAFWH